jgi:hypothetical protein
MQNTRSDENANQAGQKNTHRVPTHYERRRVFVAVKRVQNGGRGASQASRTEARQSLPRGRKPAKSPQRGDKNRNRKCRNEPRTRQCSLPEPQATPLLHAGQIDQLRIVACARAHPAMTSRMNADLPVGRFRQPSRGYNIRCGLGRTHAARMMGSLGRSRAPSSAPKAVRPHRFMRARDQTAFSTRPSA